MAFNNGVPLPKPHAYYGKAGSSMSEEGFSQTYGKERTKAGLKGEELLFEILRSHKGWLPADVPLFCSLKVPGKNTDIDFAVCKGNKILLIDAKLYRQDGGFYWNTRSNRKKIFRNFETFKSKKGGTISANRSMEMARDIIRKELRRRGMHNFKVEAVVVYVTNPKISGAKTPFTWFLKYPGEIAVRSGRNAQRYISSFLSGQPRDENTLRAESFLKSLVK